MSSRRGAGQVDMTITFPNENPDYRTARDALLAREVELRRAMEDVAAARRALPMGGAVAEDYEFTGPSGPVRLSELFAPGRDSLVVYHFMFPRDPADDRPGPHDGACPSCTALLDQLDGAAEHAAQNLDFVAIAKGPAERVLGFARERGWERLRVLSSQGTTFNRDYNAETAEGVQLPMLNVFHRDGDVVRHFWGSELFYAPVEPGQETRHVGTLEPLWNLFDFTPEGRPRDWDEQLSY